MSNRGEDSSDIVVQFRGWLSIVGKGKPAIIIAIAVGLVIVIVAPLWVLSRFIEDDLLAIVAWPLIAMLALLFLAICTTLIEASNDTDNT